MKQTQKVIAQGAEALISKSGSTVIKERIKKSYRLHKIDEKIRKSRTKKEAKLLDKATKVIYTPKVLEVDEKNKKITMEFISGKKLSEHLNKFSKKIQINIIRKIGILVAILHNSDIIHGDLTTSNIILADKKRYENIYIIDFGLGFQSYRYEDKAVDIRLFFQALESKHFTHLPILKRAFLQGYKGRSNNFQKIMDQFKKVESRGRYKKH